MSVLNNFRYIITECIRNYIMLYYSKKSYESCLLTLCVRAASGIKYEWNNSQFIMCHIVLCVLCIFKYRRYWYIATPPINTIQFNSIQDYLHSAFHDTIVAKQVGIIFSQVFGHLGSFKGWIQTEACVIPS